MMVEHYTDKEFRSKLDSLKIEFMLRVMADPSKFDEHSEKFWKDYDSLQVDKRLEQEEQSDDE